MLCEGRPHARGSSCTGACSLSRTLEAFPVGTPWDRGRGHTPGGWGHLEKGHCDDSAACNREQATVTWCRDKETLSPGGWPRKEMGCAEHRRHTHRAHGSRAPHSEMHWTWRPLWLLGPQAPGSSDSRVKGQENARKVMVKLRIWSSNDLCGAASPLVLNILWKKFHILILPHTSN